MPGSGLTHRPGHDDIRAHCRLGGGLGLAVAVAQRQSPRLPDLGDHLGVERLAGADDLAQVARPTGEIRIDEHAPHGRRGAEGGHMLGPQRRQQRRGVEARVVVEEDRRLGDPRREEAATMHAWPSPGEEILRWTSPGCKPEPVHRRQVPERIALLGVLNQLRAARGAAREVEQQPVGRRRLRVRRRCHIFFVCRAQALPPAHLPDAHLEQVGAEVGELVGVGGIADHRLGRAALEAITQVGRAECRRCGHDDGAEFHHPEHRAPQLDLVAEHDDDGVALADAAGGEEGRDLVGGGGHLIEGEFGASAVLLKDDQGRPVSCRAR
jgi:hypothetical protein